MIFNDSLDAVNDDDLPCVSNTANSVNRTNHQTMGVTETETESSSSPEKSQKENQSSTNANARFQCKICKESLSSFYKLHTHLKNVHKATLEFTCNLCGKLFSKHGDLINHLEAHKEPGKINSIQKPSDSKLEQSTAKCAQQNKAKVNNPDKSHSHSSKSKIKTKRKKLSVSNSKSKPKPKRGKRTRKRNYKNKTEKQPENTETQKTNSFTKGGKKRGATLKEQGKKSKIDETRTEISSSPSVDSDNSNDGNGSIDEPSTEISVDNPISPPPPSPPPASPPQNPTVDDDWGWDTDPQLSQRKLSTALELTQSPVSSPLPVPVLDSSPKSPPPADLPDNSVFEDYFEPLSPKLEVFDDVDLEEDLFASHSVDSSSFPSNVSEDLSSFPCQCSKCNLQFRTNDLLAIHQSFHNLLVFVNFRCGVPSCFRYFDDAVEYQRHFTSGHTKSPKRQATVPSKYCSKKSRTKSETISHEATLSKESLEGLKTLNPKAVQVQPENVGNAKLPKTENFPSLPPVIRGGKRGKDRLCINCRKTFTNPSELTVHLEVHTGTDLLPCPNCSHKFTTKCVLERHLESYHLAAVEKELNNTIAIKSFNCPGPGPEPESSLNVEAPLTTETPEPIPIPVPVPIPIQFLGGAESSNSNSNHSVHPIEMDDEEIKLMNIINAGKPYACPHCEKVFEGRSHLSIHIRRHKQEKPFTCPVSDCSSAFVTAHELRRHGKSRHPEPHDDDVQHVCPTCEKVFANKRGYTLHIQRHSTDKRFPCPEANCSKAFTSNDDLRKHIKRSHSGQREGDGNELIVSLAVSRKQLDLNSIHNQNQSVCFICESDFGTGTELDRHNRGMHPREVRVVKLGAKARLRLPCSCPETHCFAVLRNVQQLRRHRLTHARVDREIGDDVDVHLNLNAGGTPTFECKHCAKSYSLKVNLLTHLRKVHELHRSISFVCQLCGLSFLTRPAWARHKLRHEDNRDILCSLCGRLFPTQESLQVHKTQRHSRRYFRRMPHEPGNGKSGGNASVCEICGKTLANAGSLKVHMERHNSVPLMCDQCGKPCKTEVDLKLHKNTHLAVAERPFKCTFCPYRYNQHASIYSHMQVHHTGAGGSGFVESTLTAHLERNFHCDADGCSLSFTSLPCLTQHQLYHTGKKTTSCKKCGEKFVTPADLHTHKLRVHRRRYECEHCKKKFPNKVTLENHVRYKHTLEEPFTCPEPDCGRKFKTKGDVSYHMVVAHTGQYKFECEVCGKKMVTKGNYNAHMRVHTGIRVFRCEEVEGGCKASFSVESLLRKHLHKEHGRTEMAAELNEGERVKAKKKVII